MFDKRNLVPIVDARFEDFLKIFSETSIYIVESQTVAPNFDPIRLPWGDTWNLACTLNSLRRLRIVGDIGLFREE